MTRISLQPHVGDGPRAKAILYEIEQLMLAAPNKPLPHQSEFRARLAQARYDDWLEARQHA